MAVVSRARIYENVNATKPESYWNYEEHVIKWSDQENYQLVSFLFKRKKEHFFEAINIKDEKKCIIKIAKLGQYVKSLREIKIMENLRGGVNIPTLQGAVHDAFHNTVSLVFEYLGETNLDTLSAQFSDFDIRYYIYQLLKTLDFCHSMGIMHRNVKPDNIMIDPATRKLFLIGYRLAEFYHAERKYCPQSGSKKFQAPELLICYRMYDYSVDMWAVGCILASMIFKIKRFFSGTDRVNQLESIVKVLGTEELYSYISKYRMKINPKVAQVIEKNQPPTPWVNFIRQENQHLASKEAIDLVDKLLCYDHAERLTACEALQHPYFSCVASAENVDIPYHTIHGNK